MSARIGNARLHAVRSCRHLGLELIWHERAGGAYFQLFAAQGNHTAFDPALFALVGDIHNGGLAMVPEPVTLALLGLAATGLGAYVRRRRKA